jgi:Icc protein
VASPRAFRAKTGISAMPTEANGSMLSWVHFGDLHITGEDEQNYRDFLALIEDVNTHLAGHIDFAVLPGDNADDGSEEQFRLVRRGTDRLRIPLHILPGDHDRKPGNLDAFYKILDAEQLPKAVMLPGHRCLFLDIVSTGTGGPDFRLGARQLGWLERQLFAAAQDEQRSIVFMHAYPADLREDAEAVRTLFARYQVTAVDMGHTHYNEIANDGRTIYATTRSTGQIEEGPVGFSIAAVDRGVVSWRFKPLDALGRSCLSHRHRIGGWSPIPKPTTKSCAVIWKFAHKSGAADESSAPSAASAMANGFRCRRRRAKVHGVPHAPPSKVHSA